MTVPPRNGPPVTVQQEAPRATLHGILLMVGAMAAFATADVFLKYLAQTLPTAQVLGCVGLAGTVLYVGWSLVDGRPLPAGALLGRPVLLRNLGELVGTVCFVTALGRIDLSLLSAILQATPLVVTLGALVFLGMPAGWRRWAALIVGFAGVLVIIRPGMAGFDPTTLLALGAVVGLAMRDLATRAAPPRMTAPQLAASSFAVVALAGAAMLLAAPGAAAPMSPRDLGLIAGASLAAAVAYYTITLAMRTGEVAAVTPFRYTRVVFALIYGMWLFGERPDLWTVTGASIVVGSGLYTISRERAVARRRARDRMAGGG